MSFLKKLFSKKPEDLLARGDRLLADHHYYEARCLYEDAQKLAERSSNSSAGDDIVGICRDRIAKANRALAELNISEAEIAYKNGFKAKATDHLELAKTLTDDRSLREKAEKLLAVYKENINNPTLTSKEVSCSSCTTCGPEITETAQISDVDMPLPEYFDLLIQQLPKDMYARYSGLGEDFARMYVAASRNQHHEALELLEQWNDGSNSDIYWYEKGMQLYRLGHVAQSESALRTSIKTNAGNSLAHLGLALLLMDANRLAEAAQQLDSMISKGMFAEQTQLLRAQVHVASGETEKAIEVYGGLLKTPAARTAASDLHELLFHTGREEEAAFIYKQYLKGCSSH